MRPGDSVLIHAGGGGVGTLAVQFARLAGAGRVVGVAGTTARAAYAAGFGYDEVLLRDEFPGGLGGERFDVVLDPVGGRTRLDSLKALAPHGRLAVYGNIGSYEDVPVGTNGLLTEGTSLLTYNSSLLSRTHPERLAASARRALGPVARGQVRIDITAEYGPFELDTAVRRLSEGGTLGKSVLRVSDLSSG